MTGGTLNAPWGVVLAPANFGTFSNDVLVGNFGDGTINAYDTAGAFVAQMKNANNQLIATPGLWDMVFGAGGTGDPNTLYITAGGSSQTHGLFATLVPTAAAGKDFALQLSAPSATVARGNSTTINIASTAAGGFTDPVNLSCTGLPAGVTCTFNPVTIDPGAAGSTSQLTIAVGTTYIPPSPYVAGSLLMVGMFGMLWGTRRNERRAYAAKTWALGAVVLMLALTMAAVGCGYSSKGRTQPGTSVMVVGTSGGISHATPLSLTIQ
ncbi:MAG TPA: TIGR03118 family protein, partial [Terriglobales bacterium]|nr:TIGR03118 family protein [Terriglobales bacterium]